MEVFYGKIPCVVKVQTTCSYLDVAEELGEDIREGRCAKECPCPSLTKIMRRFGVSRVTAVRAVDELKKRGLVASRPGKGTFLTRTGASRKIGLIVPGICYSEIFPPICKEISRLTQKEGYALLFGDLSSNDPSERGQRAKALASQYVKEGVAGIIFQPIEFLKDSDAVNRDILSVFDAANVPVVLLDCDIIASPGRSKYDIVGINNAEAGRRLAQHIVNQGAREVLFLADPHSDYSVQNRIEGARAVVAFEKGCLRERSLDVGNATLVKGILTRRPRPQAIICRNDHQAAHLLVTLRNLGMRVPEDLLVAGFNDVDYASILSPGLTTIHLPCEDIARQAFAFLRERIGNPGMPTRECYLSAPLVVRGSTRKQSNQ